MSIAAPLLIGIAIGFIIGNVAFAQLVLYRYRRDPEGVMDWFRRWA